MYVRNNPLVLSDPSGEEVDGSQLSPLERQNLIDDWKRKSGYNSVFFDKNNKLTIDTTAGIAKNADGSLAGSAKLRDNLTDAIKSDDVFNLVEANNSSSVGFAETQRTLGIVRNGKRIENYDVRIDFSDFDKVSGDKEAKAADSIGLTVLHEIDHNLYGPIEDDGPGPGLVETKYINPIREQLGLATREEYTATAASPALRHITPDLVQLRFRINGKDKYLWWSDSQVGGRRKK